MNPGLPEALLRQIRRLNLRARRAAGDRLAGHYETAFRGAGLTFSEVRGYQPGDDVRHIDWNVTARTGTPFVKRFVEERERVVYLAIDASSSLEFGRPTKRQAIVEVAALLAFAAALQGDRVGLLRFTDRIEQSLLPMKGDAHARRIVHSVFRFVPAGQRTNLAVPLGWLQRRRRAVVFFCSDFQDTGWERSWRLLSRRHDLIAVVVSDPNEAELPRVGRVRLADAETGSELVLNTSDAAVRTGYAVAARQRRETLLKSLHAAGSDVIELSTAGGHLEALVRFFQMRERRV